jgi:penicillin-binding protein 2
VQVPRSAQRVRKFHNLYRHCPKLHIKGSQQLDPLGQRQSVAVVDRVGESAPKPADSVYLTIDDNLQYYAQQAISGFTGAAVVIEVETGRVLAMASSPGFDSNIFSPNNPNASAEIAELAPGSLVNRAAQGQYPLGSVFKIITMAAGMESGLVAPD